MRNIKYVFITVLLIVSFLGHVQGQKLSVMGDHFQKKNKTNMLALGTWAALNISVSGIAAFQTKGTQKYFHQMNAAWNIINLSIAGFGFADAMNYSSPDNYYSLFNEMKDRQAFLMLNTGLDVAYVVTGFLLKEKARTVNNHTARLKGYGNSLILQGSFLFLFDLFYYYQINTLFPTSFSEVASVEITPLFVQVSIYL